jgi:hypothetical protein
MKQTSKYALVAAAALAAAASAQAYTQGDLLVGFDGGSSDFIYDLGQFSSLTAGETWTIGTSLGTRFGVVGASTIASGSHIFSTSFDSAQNGYLQGGNYQTAKANIGTINGTLSSGLSRTTTSADTTGWTFQTDQPAGTPGNTFQNNYYNPNVSASATAYFFSNTPFETSPTLDGSFTYNAASGVLTFSAVPEPSTYGLFAGFGLLALALRRQVVKA